MLRCFLAALAVVSLLEISAQAQSCLECGSGTVWYVDASSNDPTPTGTSWAEAFPTLGAAISAASSGDCIWVAAGRYYPSATNNRAHTFLITKSLKIYGGFDGHESCFDDRAGNFSGTRFSGDIGVQGSATDNSYRIFTIQGPPAYGQTLNVVLDGMNIRDAYNNYVSDPSGGGVCCNLAQKLTIRNCLIRNNTAVTGAGLLVNSTQFNVALTQFIDNLSETEGGALWASAPGFAAGADSYVYNTIFKNNQAYGKGGAFHLEEFAEDEWVRFMNVLFHGNESNLGGVGYLTESGAAAVEQARAELVNCTLANNDASQGAALFAEESANEDPGKFTLRNCVVWGNTPGSGTVLEFTDGQGSLGDSGVAFGVVEPDDSYFDCDVLEECDAVDPPCTNFACSPIFVGTTFQLGTGSPAIDSGVSGSPGDLLPDVFDFDDDTNTTEDVPWDLDGDNRVQSGFVDRGCYETP